VVDTARRVTGIDFSVKETERLPGDPAALFVDGSRLKKLTGWAPKYDDLDFIIRTAWEWEKRLERKKPQNFSARFPTTFRNKHVSGVAIKSLF
jgi:UDP-glucose 4-epimerase